MIERVEHGDGLLELRLARPPANAIDPGLAVALAEAVAEAPGAGARALVLSGAPRLFSAGFDVPLLLGLGRAELERFLAQFNAMVLALARSELPVAAAVTGHAPAGGCVLALCCDYRVMAEGEFRIGLNETQVGLPLPRGLFHLMEYACGPRVAAQSGAQGRLWTAREALGIGLVDELAPPERVVAQAAAWCRDLLALPSQASLRLTRRYARAGLLERLAAEVIDPEAMTGHWFSPDTQRGLRAMVEKLRARR